LWPQIIDGGDKDMKKGVSKQSAAARLGCTQKAGLYVTLCDAHKLHL
jgi:hypothetical protein